MQLPAKLPGELNPISKKIKELMEKTALSKNKVTEAKICVACDITARNFKTIFERNVVSKTLMASFLYGNIITEDDKLSYYKWLDSKKKSLKGKRGSRKSTKRQESHLSA